MRLFSCMGLIKIDVAEGKSDGAVCGSESIIQFADSAIAMGEAVTVAAISFLAWFVAYPAVDEDRCPHSATALLILLCERNIDAHDTTDWLISTVRGEHLSVDEWEQWAIHPSRLFNDMLKHKWRKLTERYLLGEQGRSEIRSLARELLALV